jgi:hypothetical protein
MDTTGTTHHQLTTNEGHIRDIFDTQCGIESIDMIISNCLKPEEEITQKRNKI